MKLCTFRIDAEDRAGLVVPGAVLDLAAAFALVEHEQGRRPDPRAVAERYGEGILGFLERAATTRAVADELVERHSHGKLPAAFDGRAVLHDPAKVTLRAPLPRPPSMRDGYAFRQHVETARRNRGLDMIPEFDQFPVFYFTNHQAVIGPGELRVRPLQRERLDFELEVAAVVGRPGSDLAAARADEHVFGLTIMNDFSARALQMEEMKLSLGPAKGKDFATGLGPYLVTLDELEGAITRTPKGAVFDLEMRALVNGVEVSRGNCRDMNWTFAQILERASYGVTLYPGDVIGSGTVGTGCFLELNGTRALADKAAKPVWLVPGDEITLEVARLGRLTHTVVAVD